MTGKIPFYVVLALVLFVLLVLLVVMLKYCLCTSKRKTDGYELFEDDVVQRKPSRQSGRRKEMMEKYKIGNKSSENVPYAL